MGKSESIEQRPRIYHNLKRVKGNERDDLRSRKP